MALKRIVSNLLITCTNGCGANHTVAETQSHHKACELRQIECNSCDGKIQKIDFGKHCFDCHEDIIRSNFDKSKHEQIEKVWQTVAQDLIGGIVNLNDVETFIGLSGKYYCGQSIETCN